MAVLNKVRDTCVLLDKCLHSKALASFEFEPELKGASEDLFVSNSVNFDTEAWALIFQAYLSDSLDSTAFFGSASKDNLHISMSWSVGFLGMRYEFDVADPYLQFLETSYDALQAVRQHLRFVRLCGK